MLNKVILMGRLTKDPELKHTATDKPVASFTLAVDRGFRADGQSTDFIKVVTWRANAEFVSRWFTKGQLIVLSGRLQVRTYKDSEGNTRTVTEVVADEVFFAEARRGAVGDPKKETEPEYQEEDFEELFGDDSELPFGGAM